MIPLIFSRTGDRVKIVSVSGGRGAYYRLLNLGIKPGDIVEVIQNSGGPVIIKKQSVRIAIGAGLSGKILVIPEK